MSFVRVVQIASALLISCIVFAPTVHAEDAVHVASNASEGFTTLEEFVNALIEMPAAQFAAKGKLTSVEKIRDWHRVLTQVNAEHYRKWNKKLRLLPTTGFGNNPTFWELHVQKRPLSIGFIPQELPRPISSIVDFYHSFLSDSLDVYQARVRITPSSDLMRWALVLGKTNPKLYEAAIEKAMLLRTLGYVKEEQFHTQSPTATDEVGFEIKHSEIRELTRIESLDDLIDAFEDNTPEEFQKQWKAVSKRKAQALMRELKKDDPSLAKKVRAKLKSRTGIGFKVKGVPPQPIRQPNPRSNPTHVGFHAKTHPCDTTSILRGIIHP